MIERINMSIYNEEAMSDKDIRLRATAGKWRNSAAVRVAVTKQELNLDDLLAQITPSNLHGEVEFGKPFGQEALQ